MRAVVVYESMFGNTHQVADAIGDGLRPDFEVRVVPVSEASADVLDGADLVVVGGPTHLHGLSRASSRRSAVDAAAQADNGPTPEPGAAGPGLREWFRSLGHYPVSVKAAAFDTRLHRPVAMTGQASKKVDRKLRAHGFDVVTGPKSFLVTGQATLEPHETERARAWAAGLRALCNPAAGPAAGSAA